MWRRLERSVAVGCKCACHMPLVSTKQSSLQAGVTHVAGHRVQSVSVSRPLPTVVAGTSTKTGGERGCWVGCFSSPGMFWSVYPAGALYVAF